LEEFAYQRGEGEGIAEETFLRFGASGAEERVGESARGEGVSFIAIFVYFE
jgi:hypothetical protein